MGTKISKRYSYKSQTKVFKLILNFLLNGSHKIKFGIFEILIFFSVFLNMGPYGSENSKTLLLLQIADKYFKLVLKFPKIGPHKITLGIFEIWFSNF